MPIATVRPTTWGELIEALYASAWNESLGRYRLPYAFRGHPRVDEDLSSSLVRLAAGRPNV
ncbi:MAG: FRG domain-containing protein, partial [Acidobacteria bacterium]